jgi:hypothetical protein
VPQPYTLVEVGDEWSLGKTLKVTGVSNGPHTVQIIYNSTSAGGGDVLLRTAPANVSTSSFLNVSSDEQPVLDCSAVRNWNCADQIPLDIVTYEYLRQSSLRKMNFMQANQNRGAVVSGKHFNISVSKDNSSVILGNDLCTSTTNFILKANDKLNITFDSAPDRFTAYGISPQIWMIVAGGPSRITTTIKNVSGTYVYTNAANASAICSAWIQEYSELDSTITIQTINTGQMTSFIVNNTVYVNAPSGTSFTLTNVHPIGSGMFLVTYAGNTVPLYVIGWPDSVTGLTPPLGL